MRIKMLYVFDYVDGRGLFYRDIFVNCVELCDLWFLCYFLFNEGVWIILIVVWGGLFSYGSVSYIVIDNICVVVIISNC